MNKSDLFSLIDNNESKLKEIAFEIWSNPEIAFAEHRASNLQKEYLKNLGFKIIDVASIPTAFIAEFGSGKPVLAIMGEYDALPGLSQKISDVKEQMQGHVDGHGCGHNLIGTAGVGAVVALKELMEREDINGTIRYYGCPAEETLAGKVLMAKEGVFNDIDACVSWHPSSLNVVWGCSFLAMNSMKFKFKGVPAHAAAAPQAGRSALDAVELMNVGANYLREHVIEKARIHYVITKGGMAPNIVPEEAEVWYFVRAPKRIEVKEICDRLYKIAQGAVLMTETKMEYELLAGCYDVIPNSIIGKLMHENMTETGGPKYSDEDYEFASKLYALSTKEEKRKIMATYFAPENILDKALCNEVLTVDDKDKVMAGSTDVGDVSYIAPFAQITAATWPIGTAAHTWIATASSGSGIGLNAMIFASKTMAGTIYDLLKNNDLIESAKQEFQKTLGDYRYISPYEE
jgi:aminobenzoyl-glutamate utilization protein B